MIFRSVRLLRFLAFVIIVKNLVECSQEQYDTDRADAEADQQFRENDQDNADDCDYRGRNHPNLVFPVFVLAVFLVILLDIKQVQSVDKQQDAKDKGSRVDQPLRVDQERKADKAAYREYMKQKAELIGWEEKSQARTLIEQDRKIDAIKLVREAAGIGLAEARDMVCEHSDLL